MRKKIDIMKTNEKEITIFLIDADNVQLNVTRLYYQVQYSFTKKSMIQMKYE